MIIDARTIDHNSTIEADICIVGSGPAGMTLAMELADFDGTICLLEAGGEEMAQEHQHLYAGNEKGLSRFGYLQTCRLRMFGGTSNFWAGYCAPLHPFDFEKKDWIEHSGWPINYQDIEPFYHRAQSILQLDEYNYDVNYWRPDDAKRKPFDGPMFHTTMWQRKDLSFAKAYKQRINDQSNLSTYLYANVTKIALHDSAQHVTHLDVATLTGRKLTVSAKYVILACGGIECVRLLLASNDIMRNGIGNNYDRVGRFFMDHPHTRGALQILLSEDDTHSMTRERRQNDQRETLTCPNIMASPEYQRKERILNAAYTIRQRNSKLDPMTKSVADLARAMDGITSPVPSAVSWLYGFHEQAPNPDSRLYLGDDKDTLGMPRLTLDWQVNALDRHSLKSTLHLFAKALGVTGKGRGLIEEWVAADEPWTRGQFFSHAHHMGTTRMHDDPTLGVTDKNCKIHGVDNLFIASCSVFPTGGWANPTLSIVAFAVRIADHIKEIHSIEPK